LLRPEMTSDFLRSAQVPSYRTQGFAASYKFSGNSQRNFDMVGRNVISTSCVVLCFLLFVLCYCVFVLFVLCYCVLYCLYRVTVFCIVCTVLLCFVLFVLCYCV
jgi:hypothetical protein